MLKMPTIHTNAPQPTKRINVNHVTLVVCIMGNPHSQPLPLNKGLKFVMTDIEYFTKWVEAEAMAMTTTNRITKFLWKIVVCWLGNPKSIISNNDIQFDLDHYHNWCIELGIKFKHSSLEHPQANEQVEATNKTLLGILKKTLANKKRKLGKRTIMSLLGLTNNN